MWVMWIFFWGKKNSSSSFPAKGAADSWYFGDMLRNLQYITWIFMGFSCPKCPLKKTMLASESKLYLPCDFEDSRVPNSSTFSRKIHHPWRPLWLPQYHSVLLYEWWNHFSKDVCWAFPNFLKMGTTRGLQFCRLKKSRESRVIILNKALFFSGKSLKNRPDPCILAEKFDPLQCKNGSRDSWSLIFQSMFQPTFRTELCAKILTWQTLV